jgi:hypothetical protein
LMESKADFKFLFCRVSLSENRFALFRTHSKRRRWTAHQAAFRTPDALATCVAMASINGGDRQS